MLKIANNKLLIFLRDGSIVVAEDEKEVKAALVEYAGDTERAIVTSSVIKKLAEADYYHDECAQLKQIAESYAEQISEMTRRIEVGGVRTDLKVNVTDG